MKKGKATCSYAIQFELSGGKLKELKYNMNCDLFLFSHQPPSEVAIQVSNNISCLNLSMGGYREASLHNFNHSPNLI